jgi:hypothetical protein
MQLPPLSPALQQRRAAARGACLAAGVAWEEEEDELASGCRGVEVAYFAGSGVGRSGPGGHKRARGELTSAKGTLGVMKGFSAAVAAAVEGDGDNGDGSGDGDSGDGDSGDGDSGDVGAVDDTAADDTAADDAAEFYWGGKRAVRAAREAAAKLL